MQQSKNYGKIFRSIENYLCGRKIEEQLNSRTLTKLHDQQQIGTAGLSTFTNNCENKEKRFSKTLHTVSWPTIN